MTSILLKSFKLLFSNQYNSIIKTSTVNNFKYNDHISPLSLNKIYIRNMASKKHKKMIKLAKGYRGRANRSFNQYNILSYSRIF